MALPVLQLGYLTPVGKSDLNQEYVDAPARGGSYGIFIDAFGPKIFRLFQNVDDASFIQGQLLTRNGDNEGRTVATASTGTTTSFTVTGLTTFAISEHVGAWLYVRDNNNVAGGAPEGEISIVTSNTTARIGVDSSRPFTTALAASDILDIVGNWNVELSTNDDQAMACFGFVAAENGITTGRWGFAQTWGLVPFAFYGSATVSTANEPLVAASISGACKPASAATNMSLYIGVAPFVVQSDRASSGGPAFVQLDFGMGITTSATTAMIG